MALTKEQKQQVQVWLQDKRVSAQCPSCGQTNFVIADDLVAIPQFSEGNMSLGGKMAPMVQVACTNCAQVRLSAAVPTGLAK